MSNKAVVVTKNQSQLMAETALSKAMEGHNAGGVAFVHDKELIVTKQPSALDLEALNTLQDEYKGNAIITVFQTLQTPIDEAHLQPFEMSDEDGTHFAVFIDGSVDSYALPKQPQTAELQWFEKVFKPLFGEYVEKAGEKASVEGFVEHLKLPDVKASLVKTLGERGVVKVLASTGEINTFIQGTGMFKDTWGEVSHGYSEQTFPAEAEQSGAKKKVLSLFGSKKPKAEDAPAPVETQPEPAPAKEGDKTVIHTPDAVPKTETATISPVPMVAREGYIFARPKEHIRKNDKAMKKALNGAYAGGLPKGWKQTDWFEIPASKMTNMWEKRDETALSAALTKAKTTPAEAKTGLVPEAQQKAFKEVFAKSPSITKAMEDPSLPTLEMLQTDENKHPTWFDKTGIHVQDTLNWPLEKVAELDKDYHELFVLRHNAIRNLLIKMLHEHPAPKKEEAPKTEEVVQTRPKLSLFKKTA